jgi:hypothetical protein
MANDRIPDHEYYDFFKNDIHDIDNIRTWAQDIYA